MAINFKEISQSLDANIRPAAEKYLPTVYFCLRREITNELVNQYSAKIIGSKDEYIPIDWSDLKTKAQQAFYEQFGHYDPNTKQIHNIFSYDEMLEFALELLGLQSLDDLVAREKKISKHFETLKKQKEQTEGSFEKPATNGKKPKPSSQNKEELPL